MISMKTSFFYIGLFTFLCFFSHDYFALEMKKLDDPPAKTQKPSIFEDIFVLPQLNQEPLVLPETSPQGKLDFGSKNTACVS